MNRVAVLLLLGACAHTPPPDETSDACAELAAYTFVSLVRDHGCGGHVLRHLGEHAYSFAQNDPWGSPYLLRGKFRQYLEVRSCGPDRLPDTEDDVVSRINFP